MSPSERTPAPNPGPTHRFSLVAAAEAARTASVETRRECREFGDRYRRDLQLMPRVGALLADVTGDSVTP